MAGWRRVVELAMTNEEVARLTAISRSRTSPRARWSGRKCFSASGRAHRFLRWHEGWEPITGRSNGASNDLSRTVAVNALVLGQVFYLLNSRFKLDSSLSLKAHRGNRYLPLGIGVVVVLQILFTYVSPFQALFDTVAMPLSTWPPLFVAAVVFLLVVEVEKFILRSFGAARRTATIAPSRA